MTQHVQRTAANPPSYPPATPPLPQPNFQKIQKICTKRTQFSTPNTNKTINILKNTIGFAFGFHPSFHPTGRGLIIETIDLAGARQDRLKIRQPVPGVLRWA